MSLFLRFEKFKVDIDRARDMVGLGQTYGSMTNGLIDSSDMYRSSLVQAISALDYYVHGVVIERAVDVIFGRLSGSDAKDVPKFGLSFPLVSQILAAEEEFEREQLVRIYVSQALGFQTFQRSNAIGQALASVGISKFWSSGFSPTEKSLAKHLDLIVERRNRIVHQADSDPLNFGDQTEITYSDALEAVEVVSLVASRINELCGASRLRV